MRVGKEAVIWGNLLRSKFKMTVVVSEAQPHGVITIKIHPDDLATLSKQVVAALRYTNPNWEPSTSPGPPNPLEDAQELQRDAFGKHLALIFLF
ncbi:hypothetical protein Pyn_22610 [Prunus yedoensis var. nudiflora]|uniref:Uncharacterized protein n=1 Tax=Prunus yedoensis var. nudiflora TaxID=2094558 RepID=A0A314ZK46_PRUYE|nr:hypothetical protein Pyn_22610 [Prunus yedoensis var. nudiflora]